MRGMGVKLGGTAFFVRMSSEIPGLSFTYLVTAKHIIEEICKPPKNGKIYVRANVKQGGATHISTSLSDWHLASAEAAEKEVDVAVMPFELDGLDFMSIPVESAATYKRIQDENISIGDEICIIGLFTRLEGEHRNMPIARIGNIAAFPEDKVRTKAGLIDAYLVEARSIGGLSGSPVMVNITGFRPPDHARPEPGVRINIFFWLGLIHGHWDTELSGDYSATEDTFNNEKLNMGIAVVVPVDKILEVLNHEKLSKERERITKSMCEKRMPTPDSTGSR